MLRVAVRVDVWVFLADVAVNSSVIALSYGPDNAGSQVIKQCMKN